MKRAFGCAALASAVGRPVVALPVDQRAPAARSVMPSHQTSPSSVSATLVKIVFARDRRHRVRVGLVRWCPGATPKKPASGLIAYRLAVLAGLDPGDVVADGRDLPALVRTPSAGSASRSWSCRRRSGTRPRRTIFSPSGDFDAEDQHVLGEPALVAGHAPRRCAARSTSCRAARCRRSREPYDQIVRSSGKWTMYLSLGVARPRRRRPGPARAARRPSAGSGTNVAVARARRAPRGPCGS